MRYSTILIVLSSFAATIFANSESRLYRHLEFLQQVREIDNRKSHLTNSLYNTMEQNELYTMRGYTLDQRLNMLYPKVVDYCYDSPDAFASCLSISDHCDILNPILQSASINMFSQYIKESFTPYTDAFDVDKFFESMHVFVRNSIRPMQMELLRHFPSTIIQNIITSEELLSRTNNFASWLRVADNLAAQLRYMLTLYRQSWTKDIEIWEERLTMLGQTVLYRQPATCLSMTQDIINVIVDAPFGDFKTFDRKYLETNPTRQSIGSFIQSGSAIINARLFVLKFPESTPLRKIIESINYKTNYKAMYEINQFLTMKALATHEDLRMRGEITNANKFHFATKLADSCLESEKTLSFCMAIAEAVPELYDYVLDRHITVKYFDTLLPQINDIMPPTERILPSKLNYHLTALYVSLKQIFQAESSDPLLEYWSNVNWAPENAKARERFMVLMGYKATKHFWNVLPPEGIESSVSKSVGVQVKQLYDLRDISLQDYWNRFYLLMQENRVHWWKMLLELRNIHNRLEGAGLLNSLSLLETLQLLQVEGLRLAELNKITLTDANRRQITKKGIFIQGDFDTIRLLYHILDKRAKKKKGWKNKIGLVTRNKRELPGLPSYKLPDQIAKETYDSQNLKRLTQFIQ